MKLLGLGLAVASIALGAVVTIQESGTLTTGSGAPVNGQLSITPTAAFLAADGNQVTVTPVVAFAVNGFLNVQLEANDTGLPALTRYVVVYTLKGGGQYTEIWNVTGSGTKRVSDVRVATGIAPGYVVQLSQLGQGGATANQTLGWNGLTWGPVTPAAATVSSVFGRTGAVVAAGADYTAAQVTNALSSILSYPDPAWITSLASGKLVFTDVMTGNVSTSMHGFTPKLPNDATKYLDGTGGFSVPAGGGGGLSGGTSPRFAYWTSSTTLGSHQYLTNGLAGQTYTPESPVLQDSALCSFYMTTTGAGPFTSRAVYDCKAAAGTIQNFQLIDSGGNVALFNSIGSGWSLSGVTAPVTIVDDLMIPVATYDNQQGTFARGQWDAVSGNGPTYTGILGTAGQMAVMQFGNVGSPTMYHRRILPSTWTGAVDIQIGWIDPVGAGSVKWTVDLACAAFPATTGAYYDNGFSNITFNASSSVTTVSNTRLNKSAITGLTATGCVAGGQMWVRVLRDNSIGSNLGGNADVAYVVVTIRRTSS